MVPISLWDVSEVGIAEEMYRRITASQHRKRLAHDAQDGQDADASGFRFGGKKEAASVCRGCVSLWILNQSLLIINELALYDAKPIIANFSGPYGLSMAQFSVCGACGFVLTANSPITT